MTAEYYTTHKCDTIESYSIQLSSSQSLPASFLILLWVISCRTYPDQPTAIYDTTRFLRATWYPLLDSAMIQFVSLTCLTHMSHSYVSLICLDSAMIQLQLHYCWCIYTYIAVGWSGHGTVHPEVVGSIPAKTPKIENLNLHGFEIHRPSSKGTELLLQVPKAIINQSAN